MTPWSEEASGDAHSGRYTGHWLIVTAASPIRLAAQVPAGDMFDEWNQQAVRSIVTVAGYNPPVAHIYHHLRCYCVQPTCSAIF